MLALTPSSPVGVTGRSRFPGGETVVSVSFALLPGLPQVPSPVTVSPNRVWGQTFERIFFFLHLPECDRESMPMSRLASLSLGGSMTPQGAMHPKHILPKMRMGQHDP